MRTKNLFPRLSDTCIVYVGVSSDTYETIRLALHEYHAQVLKCEHIEEVHSAIAQKDCTYTVLILDGTEQSPHILPDIVSFIEIISHPSILLTHTSSLADHPVIAILEKRVSALLDGVLNPFELCTTIDILIRQEERKHKQTQQHIISEQQMNPYHLFESFMHNIPIPLFVTSPDQRIVLANSFFETFTNKTTGELASQTLTELFGKETAEYFQDQNQQVLSQGSSITFSETITSSFGDRYMNTIKFPVPSEYGDSVVGVGGIALDITSVINADREMRKQSDLLLHIFNQIPVMIMIHDADFRIISVNNAFEKETGWQASDVVGIDDPLRLFYPKESHYSEVLRSIRESSGEWVETQKLTKFGTYIHCLWSNIILNDGRVVRFGVNISDRKEMERQLLENQERKELAVEAAHLGVWDCNVTDNTLYWEPSMFSLYGIPVDTRDSIADVYQRCLHPDDREYVNQESMYAITNELPLDIEFRIIRPEDQSLRYIRSFAKTYHHINGSDKLHLVGINLDITEQKLAKLQLQESEQRFRVLVEHIQDVIISVNADMSIAYMSPNGEQMWGYTPAEFQADATLAPRIVHPQYASVFYSIWEEFWKSGTFPEENAIIGWIHKDGYTVYVEFSFINQYDATGIVIGFHGVGRNVTDRILAEHELIDSKNMIRSILDASGAGIIICDADGIVYDTNASLVRSLGYSEKELNGLHLTTIIHDDHQKEFMRQFQMFLDGTLPLWSGDRQFISKDNDIRYLLFSSGKFTDSHANEYVVLSTIDISDKHDIEDQMMRMQRMERVGMLAGGIAHDMNNVLAPIILGLEILESTVHDDANLKRVDRIKQMAWRGANLMKQILIFSRGGVREHNAITIADLFNEIRLIVQETFPKDIQIRFSSPHHIPMMMADSNQMHQVLMNLLINSRDALPHGGMISVSASFKHHLVPNPRQILAGAHEGTYLCITVHDNGMGMSKSVQEKIFEPFFTTKSSHQGTGLGLSTVFGIVKNHDGFIDVESTLGKGTTFFIYIPSSPSSSIDNNDVSINAPLLGHHETILIIDDEESVRTLLADSLESAGYMTMQAVHGKDALHILQSHHATIKMAIVDIIMPVMDGITTIRAIQELYPNICIIISSGYMTEEHQNALKTMSVNAILEKPHSRHELLYHVHQAFHPPQ